MELDVYILSLMETVEYPNVVDMEHEYLGELYSTRHKWGFRVRIRQASNSWLGVEMTCDDV